MLMKDADPRVRLAASQNVLNRAWGKPSQAIEAELTRTTYVATLPEVCSSVEEWERKAQATLK